MKAVEEAKYIEQFISTYYCFSDKEKGKRESACLRVQHKYAILEPQPKDWLIGRYEIPSVGFAMQDAGMGYNLNGGRFEEVLSKLPTDWQETLRGMVEQWKKETGKEQLIQKTPADILELMPSDRFAEESNVGFWLCRMGSTHLDYDKLLQKGITGLREEILEAKDAHTDEQAARLYDDMLDALDAFVDIALAHKERILQSDHPQKQKIADVLTAITQDKPKTFHQAVQLMFLYAVLSGTYNYGRMDEYLGDFLDNDLKTAEITREEAKQILISLWQLMIFRETTWDGRVVIGGLGRRNEKEADACAKLILEVADEVKDVLPQLTLRLYKGQDPQLLEMALQHIGKGNIYPMLYNDEVNVASVQKAFAVTKEEAVQYLPYGCGEYILYHRSVGTPSDIVNLLKALEITIFDGYDHVSQKQIGLHTGAFEDFETFEAFYEAYCKQLERYIAAQARQEKVEYDVAGAHSPFLFASMLYDDCIKRGKAIFAGGVQYLGGTLETYGNTNTADSLTAIKKLVFDHPIISQKELKEMLQQNFAGYEKQRQWLLDAPKYGNDNDEADEMAKKVHQHVCEFTRSQAKEVGLDSYLVVVINNSANTSTGKYTMASADGRKAYEPMANANNPAGGRDQNGLTAFLNSLVKLPTDIHAGSVQNAKFSKEMFTTYLEKTKTAIAVYFANGGSQLMLNVLGRSDLENALKEPEKYRNLIVRVGGFSARFVELEPGVQREILSRTMY